jgi:glycerate kinase
VCKSAFNLELIKYIITTPYDETTFDCEVGYDKEKKRIYIESARVLGSRVIPEEKRNPLILSSKGFGDLFLRIIDDIKLNKISVETVIIGVGGTGTNDLGLGVCSRFGLELYDIFGKKDKIIPEFYYRIRDVKLGNPEIPFKVMVIVDVENPLLGPKGAARTFGAQKGADRGEVEVMELGFNKIINILKNKNLKRSFDYLPGAGGGLATGLHIFFNASFIKADEFIRKQLKLEEKIRDIDIIITGEGYFDMQSLCGKGAGVVINIAAEFNKEVILCCGKIEEKVKDKLGHNVDVIELVSFFDSKKDSMSNFEKGIGLASRKIISLL